MSLVSFFATEPFTKLAGRGAALCSDWLSVWGRSFCSELDSISRSIRTDGEQQESSLENRPNGNELQKWPPSICNIKEGGGEMP